MSLQPPASSRQSSAVPTWPWRVWDADWYAMAPEVELARFPAEPGGRSVSITRHGPISVERTGRTSWKEIPTIWISASLNAEKDRKKLDEVVLFEVELEPEDGSGPRFKKVVSGGKVDRFHRVAGQLRWFFDLVQISPFSPDPGWHSSLSIEIGRAKPIPGSSIFDLDELAVFHLLGEKSPVFWGKDRLKDWVRGRPDVEWLEGNSG